MIPGAHVAAVIDVGSNSVLLLTVTVGSDGTTRALDEGLASTRLGAGLRDGGRLDPTRVAATTDAITAFAMRARAAGARRVWGLATAAARRASDGSAFVRAAGQAAQIPLEVLSGAREAELAYAAVAHALADVRQPLLVADLGAGTLELTLGVGELIEETTSLPLGALRLSEEYLQGDPPSPESLRALTDRVRALLEDSPLVQRARARRIVLAAAGGTASALGALDCGVQRYEPARVHAHELGVVTLGTLARVLSAMSTPARQALPAVEAGRAALLPAGAAVLAVLVDVLGTNGLTVSEHGVRHGYLRAQLGTTSPSAIHFHSLWA